MGTTLVMSPPKAGIFRLSNGRTLRTTPVFDLYWRFAVERQRVFFERTEGSLPPWTDDPVIGAYRFTNVYRASDRASQFLIRHVIYDGDQSGEEIFFRTLLFKLFNRIGTWKLLQTHLGALSWKGFAHDRYKAVLDRALRAGQRIYSPAYIMPCPAFGATRKHTNHLLLLAQMMKTGVPKEVASARSMRRVFEILRSLPSLGSFLAFQFAIDLNYSELTNFSEMDFVVAGPGASSGLRKAFPNSGGLSDEELIREVTEAAEREFQQRDLRFRNLWGRPLQLIDCQNLFCEIDKYTRVAFPGAIGSGRTRIKRRFEVDSETLAPPVQFYPPKWRLRVTPAQSGNPKTCAPGGFYGKEKNLY
ncbi:MAG: nucleotide kinase domain-containing protein [Elusimicrobiota bacterium]